MPILDIQKTTGCVAIRTKIVVSNLRSLQCKYAMITSLGFPTEKTKCQQDDTAWHRTAIVSLIVLKGLIKPIRNELMYGLPWQTVYALTQMSLGSVLTHWGQDKMAAIFQTSHSNAFSWMKMSVFRLNFHWSLFLRVQLTIFQHWFR